MTRQDAIDHFKTVADLATALGITTQAVYDWGDRVPELRQLQLEKITKGALKSEAPIQTQAA